MKTRSQIKTFITNEKEARARYFRMVKDAAMEAEFSVVKDRETLLEDPRGPQSEGKYSELLLDMLLAMTYTVGGAAFKAVVSQFVGAIVGTRSNLLWLKKSDGTLEAGMSIRDGVLQVHPLKGPGGGRVLKQMKEARVEANKKDRATVAWNLGVEVLSDSAVLIGKLEDKDAAWPTASARRPGKPVPLIESVNAAAEAQLAFEQRFMNMLWEIVDEAPSDDVAQAIYGSVQSIAMSEDQWKETKSRYRGLFTTFVWLQHTGDPTNLARMANHLLKYKRGNPLIRIPEKPMLIDFSGSLRIVARPELVEHMAKTILYVKEYEQTWEPNGLYAKERYAIDFLPSSLTVWEHFVEVKHILFPTQRTVVPNDSRPRAGLSRQAYAELVGLYLIPSLERVYRMDKDFSKVIQLTR